MNLVISRCSVMLSSSASERYTAISVDGSINSRPLSIFLRLCDIWSKERQARTGISTIIPKIYWGWTKPELIYKNIPFLAIPTFCLHAFNPHSTLLIEKVRKDPKMDPKSKHVTFEVKMKRLESGYTLMMCNSGRMEKWLVIIYEEQEHTLTPPAVDTRGVWGETASTYEDSRGKWGAQRKQVSVIIES